jgi:hypothetical protein
MKISIGWFAEHEVQEATHVGRVFPWFVVDL